MTEESTEPTEEPKPAEKSDVARKLEAVGWGLFFIWVGIVLLAQVESGVGLLGVGVITLGVQGARRYFGLKIEGLWIVIGLVFAWGGIWQLLDAKRDLVPILLIVAGAALVLMILIGKRPSSP